jgi:aspartate kinase
VPTAEHLTYLGYPEMQELASHGAKVLNAQAVDWAERAGIVIHARSSAESATRETRIGPPTPARLPSGHGAAFDHRATAVTATARLIEIESDHHGLALLAALSSEGVALRELTLRHQPSGGAALLASFGSEDLPDLPRTLAALATAAPADLQVGHSAGSVTAVGPSLGSSPQLLGLVSRALGAAGLHPRRYSTSPLRLTVSLPSAEVEPATRLLHDLLCGRREKR